MITFLLVGRKGDADHEKLRSPVVSGLSFETKRAALKSTISESKSGASETQEEFPQTDSFLESS
jgi:hypothetical protein